MSIQHIRKPLFIAFALLLSLTTPGIVRPPVAPATGDNILTLTAPSFLAVANAEETAPTAFPVDEAGISAYFKSAMSINLADVRRVFRVIEVETPDYIIGSVPLPGYAETEDVHAYVHRDGWFLAYYLNADPSGKIVDWRAYHDGGRTAITTKLENALGLAASFAAVPLTAITFYDFRYPNATHLMFAAEWAFAAEDSFQINLPSNFVYHERSWSFGTTDRGAIGLNGSWLANVNCDNFCTDQGTLTNAQLLPNQFHTVTAWGEGGNYPDYGYAALVLVYRVP